MQQVSVSTKVCDPFPSTNTGQTTNFSEYRHWRLSAYILFLPIYITVQCGAH